MARILYGVAGEGLGHAVRSYPVIKHLQKKHTVKVVAGGKAYWYLSKYCKVEKITYYHLLYRNNAVANILTFFSNFLNIPPVLISGRRVSTLIRKFKPHLAITDFEPITAHQAQWKNIPLISLDNQHLITGADHQKITQHYKTTFLLTEIVIDSFIPRADRYIINSFVPGSSIEHEAYIVKPILREKILKLKPIQKKHILVYQTSTTNKNLTNILHQFKQEHFIVYGFNAHKKKKNITFKPFSEKEFLEDLRTCKAVISNGGFNTISEALYLKKPVLANPIKRHFEQILNAIHVDLWQYGLFAKELDKKVLTNFLENLDHFKEMLKKFEKYSNKEAFTILDKEIVALTRANSRPAKRRARS